MACLFIGFKSDRKYFADHERSFGKKKHPGNITDLKVTIMQSWMGLDQNSIRQFLRQYTTAHCSVLRGTLGSYWFCWPERFYISLLMKVKKINFKTCRQHWTATASIYTPHPSIGQGGIFHPGHWRFRLRSWRGIASSSGYVRAYHRVCKFRAICRTEPILYYS